YAGESDGRGGGAFGGKIRDDNSHQGLRTIDKEPDRHIEDRVEPEHVAWRLPEEKNRQSAEEHADEAERDAAAAEAAIGEVAGDQHAGEPGAFESSHQPAGVDELGALDLFEHCRGPVKKCEADRVDKEISGRHEPDKFVREHAIPEKLFELGG